MTQTSPIKSLAQHRMLARAVTDDAYAKERGISAIHAQAMLDAHTQAGAPELPERVEGRTSTKSARSTKPRKYNLLGAS